MINVKNLSKTFRNGDEDFAALKDVSFAFRDAGLYFVTGKSGAGKSTFLDILGGLQKPTSGAVEADRWLTFSYVFQDENLVFCLSLMDNLRLVEEDEGRIDAVLTSVGLLGKKATAVSLLSKGERARLAIARALLARADAILLDEPTGNLDSASAKIVYDLLKKIAASKLVVVVTHDAEAAKAYGDCVLTLSDGALVSIEEKGTEPSPAPAVKKAKATTSIPFGVAARYAFRKAFAMKAKLVLSSLSLALSAVLLFVGCDSAFFNSASYIRQAIQEGDVATYRVGKYKDGEGFGGSTGTISNGVSLYASVSSYGVKPQVGCGFFSSSTGDLYFNFVDDSSPVIDGVSYTVPEGGILVSDYVSNALSLSAGEEIDYGSLKLTVSETYPTGYASLGGTDASQAFLENDYCYCYVGSADFVSAEAQQGISAPDFLAPEGGSAPSEPFYYPGSQTVTYAYGRAPEASNEIAVSTDYINNYWPQGDASEVLGKTFQVEEKDDDSFNIASNLSSLAVVGVWDSTNRVNALAFLTGASFFETLGDDFRLAATNSFFFVDKAGACALAEAELDSTLVLGVDGVSNPADEAFYVSQAFKDLGKVALIASLAFLALALSAMLLYSLGNVKANEKDVAMLRLLGKKPSDIMWVFALMALAPSLIALVAAYAGGPLLSAWVGATFAHAIGTTLNPPALSVWAFFIVLIPLAIVPLLASILSVLRIQRCEPVDIFKRNLI